MLFDGIEFSIRRAGFTPTELKTEAQLKMENIDDPLKIIFIHLVLDGDLPNITEEKFIEIAYNAKKTGPVSQALSVLDITVSATLKK